MKYKTLYYLIIFCVLSMPNHATDVKKILDQMSVGEKQALTQLFHSLIQNDHLGYTLFANKPVCQSSHFIVTPVGNLFAKYRCEGIFWNQWKIWKKYEDLLTHNNYLLIEEFSICPSNIVTCIFINKRAFLKKVNRHIDIFRRFLGSDTTAQDLLDQIEKTNKLSPIIKDNQMLWGILLDYGVRNASLFYRREQIRPFFSKKKTPQIMTQAPLPSKRFSSLKEEYDYLNAHLKQFDESDYSPHLIQSVHFMADLKHPETLFLKRKYEKLKGEISAIYAQGDFLEITLYQISQ